MEPTSTKKASFAPLAASEGPDCDRVNTILDQLLVGEQPTAEDSDYIIDHAEDCSPCFDSLDKQQIFIGFMSQHLGRKTAPASLSRTILAKVQVEMA
jgi:hypothetical protein